MTLGGKQVKMLRLALVEAFPTHDDLRRMFREELDRSLDAIALGNSLDDIASKVIERAQAQGWVPALIAGARAANPQSEALAACAQALVPARQPAEAGSFEALIAVRNPLLHIDVFLDFLERSKRRVCRIETDAGAPRGSGFLVGPDVVLTNHHVIAPFLEQKTPPIRARFDYLAASDGHSVSAGRSFAVADPWLLASAPPSPLDFAKAASSAEPDPTHLDFALFRLQGSPGHEIVNGAARGWVRFSGAPPYPQPGDVLCAIQHPAGGPLQIAIDTVIGVNANRTRVRYRTNTLSGASGSPCFDLNREIVALHHGGTSEYNQGIPAAALRAHFTAHGADRHLGGPTP